MKPFFGKQETQSDEIAKIPQSCASCGLHKAAKNPRMKPWGKFGKRIMIIGEAPTKKDNNRGKCWTGEQGELLKHIFKKNGIHVFRDCITTYACICPVPKNHRPEDKEIMCCRKKVMRAIKEYKPELIFLVGTVAVASVIGKSWKKGLGGMERWRGFCIPDREHKAWLCPIYSPKYTETRDIWKPVNLAEVILEKDVKRALTKLGKPIIFEDEKKSITYIESDKHFKSILPRLHAADLMSFDYESTGLKPQAKGHKITNTAACIGMKECYSWMNNKYRNLLFKGVLESMTVRKSAHNLSFEDMWSRVILNAQVQNWYWCTMNTAHILDNRKGIASLKFQAYINYGVADYDSHVNPFLQSGDDDGANSFNQIEKYIKQYGERPILTYCGLDAIYGYHLTITQRKIIEHHSVR
jgi:uracil-DNA glycosylase family 4